MLTPTRIYISVPKDAWLEPGQLDVKRGIFERVKSVGFEPHEFLSSGDFSTFPWSYENLQSILGRCQGALILGFVRWDVRDAERNYKFITAYNHYEGALALAKDLPTFILMHEHVHKAGIAIKGRSKYFVRLPDLVNSAWLDTGPFSSKFNSWVGEVKERHHIFLGYSSAAQTTAAKIKTFLTSKGVSVLDRVVDSSQPTPGASEMEGAAKTCMGSIFLFTKDDEDMAGARASSRDNIMFEAGYFLHAKGSDKTLIIREESASMPAALRALQSLSLHRLKDISLIENDLGQFIVKNF